MTREVKEQRLYQFFIVPLFDNRPLNKAFKLGPALHPNSLIRVTTLLDRLLSPLLVGPFTGNSFQHVISKGLFALRHAGYIMLLAAVPPDIDVIYQHETCTLRLSVESSINPGNICSTAHNMGRNFI